MVERFAFIGDIHGDYTRLLALLAKLDRRRLVFLGDYLDRGPNPREVVRILLEIEKRGQNPVFLSGNHEIGLLAYLSEKLSFLEYAWMGGVSTIRSYIGRATDDVRAELAAAIPAAHYEFLSGCQPFFETDEFVASHSGINPARPEDRGLGETVLGRHSSLFCDDPGLTKLVVCGHYLQPTLRPLVSSRLVCLNTGCGTIGGPATALLYPEMTILQA